MSLIPEQLEAMNHPPIDVPPATPFGPAHGPHDWFDELLREAFETAQAPLPLRLADILEEIALSLRRYLYFPHSATSMLIACWVVATYCFREFSYCGYLSIRSKRSGSGKTRLLDLLSALSKDNPPIYTSPTPAVLFRGTQDVVLIDEVDRLRGQDREAYGLLMAVLNAGFASNGIVPRTERVNDRGKFAVVNHPVYGPKAFAGLEKLEPTLASRCFHIEMTQAPYRLPRFSMRLFGATAVRLRNDFDSWTCSHQKEITEAYSDLPDELRVLRRYDDRYQDISEPLVVLATLADTEWGVQRILPVLLEGLRLASSQRSPTQGERLAVALQEILSPALGDREELFIPSQDLLGMVQTGGLTSIDSTMDLAKRFSQFGLFPRSSGMLRGYDITRAWLMALKTSRQGQTPL